MILLARSKPWALAGQVVEAAKELAPESNWRQGRSPCLPLSQPWAWSLAEWKREAAKELKRLSRRSLCLPLPQPWAWSPAEWKLEAAKASVQ